MDNATRPDPQQHAAVVIGAPERCIAACERVAELGARQDPAPGVGWP